MPQVAPVWAEKIDAPPEALEFYRAVQNLQTSDAFSQCHVYNGARIKNIPHVMVSQVMTAMPALLAWFLGEDSYKKNCETPGCCNPFHHLKRAPKEILREKKLKAKKSSITEPTLPEPSLDEYRDLLEYHIDKEQIKTLDYRTVRPIIPRSDIPDDILTLLLEKMKNG